MRRSITRLLSSAISNLNHKSTTLGSFQYRQLFSAASTSSTHHIFSQQAFPPLHHTNQVQHGNFNTSTTTATQINSSQLTSQDLTEGAFHQLADHTLDDYVEKLEIYVESLDMEDDCDVEYSQGVLTVKLGGLGTFVINKQTPNRQIWLSSPVSGPFRYDFHRGQWEYTRDGHALHSKLEHELEALTGQSIDLNPCVSCEKLGACGVGGPTCLSDNK